MDENRKEVRESWAEVVQGEKSHLEENTKRKRSKDYKNTKIGRQGEKMRTQKGHAVN